jgi:trans-aconitate 2-methyltransferase
MQALSRPARSVMCNVTAVTWDASQYRRFSAERSLPFDELMAMIDRSALGRAGYGRAVDLGCGPGELTARLAGDFGMTVVGIDSSPAMLEAARDYLGPRVSFEEGGIESWTPPGDLQLVVASASLQWVPDHRAVLERWSAALAPGGQLAVQVPANADSPTHRVARALAQQEPYLSAFGPTGPPPDPVERNVLAPECYSTLLHELGFVQQEVRLRVYPHLLASTGDAVEWVKGTTLTRFAALLPADLYARYLEEYEIALLDEVGSQSPFFYPFKRILFVARRPD